MEEEFVFGYIKETAHGRFEVRGIDEDTFRKRLNKYLMEGEEFLALAKYLSYEEYSDFQLYLEELEKADIPYGKIAFAYQTGFETDRCGVNVLTNVTSHYVELEDLAEIDTVLYENQKLRRRVDIISLSLAEDWVVISGNCFSKKLMDKWKDYMERDKNTLIDHISIDNENWTFDYVKE
jgi:hypothetical protein